MTDLNERLERERDRGAKNPFVAHNHICLESITEDSATAYVDLVHESHNFSGGIHGGLFFALTDYCAAVTARADGRRYVTQTADVHYLKNVKEGRITARSHLLHRGRSGCVVDVHVYSDDEQLLFKAVVSMYPVG